MTGPPRLWESALLSRPIMESPGPVVSTSSKPDIFALTSGVRGPIWVFNPQDIGVRSNVMWSPVDGCSNPARSYDSTGIPHPGCGLCSVRASVPSARDAVHGEAGGRAGKQVDELLRAAFLVL